MKTGKQFVVMATIAILGIMVVVALMAVIGCKNEPTPDPKCECPNGTVHPYGQPCGCGTNDCTCTEAPNPVPELQTPVTKDLSFGTGCKVTIQSDDKFLKADWDALCGKAVAAIGRGHGAANVIVKGAIESHFSTYPVIIILSTTLTKRCEVRAGEPNIIYFKADDAVIDGITAADMFSVVNEVVLGGSFGVAKAKIVPKSLDVLIAEANQSRQLGTECLTI